MANPFFSALQLARAVGVDRGTVTRWAAEGCPATKPEGAARGAAWVFELPLMVAWLQDRAEAAGRDGRQPSSMAKIERTKAQVALELAELRLGELRGQVVRVDDVLEVVGQDYDAIRKALRSIAGRLGPELWVAVTGGGTETDCTELIEREIDDVLGNLSGEQHYGGDRKRGSARTRNGSGGPAKAARRPRARKKRQAKATAKATAKPVGRRKSTAKR